MDMEQYAKVVNDAIGGLREEFKGILALEKEQISKNEDKEEGNLWLTIYLNLLKRSEIHIDDIATQADKTLATFRERYNVNRK